MKTVALILLLTTVLVNESCTSVKTDYNTDPAVRQQKYASYVWPPAPDIPRIRLIDILGNRFDVEPTSGITKALTGSVAYGKFDFLKKPFGVAIDSQGRVLVSDPVLAVIVRFDREGRRYDIFGVGGTTRLSHPMGLAIGPDDTVYVADVGQQKVLAYSNDGVLKAVYGKKGELSNPTDVAVSLDGEMLFVSDSKAHKIVIFQLPGGDFLNSFGSRGARAGEFNFPTSLAFSPEGDLFVVDQINSRVQILTPEGEPLDSFGDLGTGTGQFVRPKGVAVDASGLIFVSDAAFGNVQIFDADLQLLTFVGAGGHGPGLFDVPGEVAARNGKFAMIDQLNKRVQLFEFIQDLGGE